MFILIIWLTPSFNKMNSMRLSQEDPTAGNSRKGLEADNQKMVTIAKGMDFPSFKTKTVLNSSFVHKI